MSPITEALLRKLKMNHRNVRIARSKHRTLEFYLSSVSMFSPGFRPTLFVSLDGVDIVNGMKHTGSFLQTYK